MTRKTRQAARALAALAALAVLSAALPAGAETLALTLEEARGIALAENKTLAIAEAGMDAAAARLGQARSTFLPQITGSASYTKLDEVPYMDASGFGQMFSPLMEPFNYLVDQGYLDPATLAGLSSTEGGDKIYMGDDDIYSAGLQATQPLFTGGGILNSYWAAKHGARAEEWSHARAVDQTRYDVTEAYVNLMRARAGLDVMERALEQMQSHLSDLESLYSEGMIIESDIMAARVQAASVRLSRNSAEHGARLANAFLCFQMGIDVDTEIDPIDTLEDSTTPRLDVAEWTVRALEARPDLLAARESREAAGNYVGAARSQYFPQVALVGSYNWDRPNREYEPEFYDSWSVTVAAEMKIFDWGNIRNSVKEAKAGRLAAEKAAEMVEDAVRLEVKESVLALDEAVEAVAIASDGAAQARESLRVVRESFRNGMSTNSDVLDAQTALTTAEMQLIDAKAGLKLSKTGLELATGVDH